MANSADRPKMPSHVDDRLSLFDRFATYTAELVHRAWFFAFCGVLVLIWVPTIWLMPTIEGWALTIDTITSIITFLLVALLQNTQTRAENVTQRKLNAIADALGHLMGEFGSEHPDLTRRRKELTAAVGLEHREGST